MLWRREVLKSCMCHWVAKVTGHPGRNNRKCEQGVTLIGPLLARVQPLSLLSLCVSGVDGAVSPKIKKMRTCSVDAWLVCLCAAQEKSNHNGKFKVHIPTDLCPLPGSTSLLCYCSKSESLCQSNCMYWLLSLSPWTSYQAKFFLLYPEDKLRRQTQRIKTMRVLC